MARAGPVSSGGGGLGPARFGSYRKRLGGASVSTAGVGCSLPASEAVTAVTSYPPNYPLFFGHRVTNALSCVAVQPPAPTSR
jgi:hypothetical protein